MILFLITLMGCQGRTIVVSPEFDYCDPIVDEYTLLYKQRKFKEIEARFNELKIKEFGIKTAKLLECIDILRQFSALEDEPDLTWVVIN